MIIEEGEETLGKLDLIIKVEFTDGSEVSLGGEDIIILTPAEGNRTVELDDVKLRLIRNLQRVEREITGIPEPE